MRIPFLQVEPTTRCNYTCGFCAGRHMAQRDLPLADLERFLDGVQDLQHVELQGEGEPLMHPDFAGLVAALRSRFPAVGISLITNGSLFTRDNIELLLASRIERIYVSMESADGERFQAIRGGSLERVKRGIRQFLEARAARATALPTLGLAVTILHSTVDELFTSIAPLYRELGLDGGINLQPLQGMPQYVQAYDAAMRAEQLTREDMLHVQTRLRADASVTTLLEQRMRHPGFYERLYASTRGRPACPWLENGLYVAMDGTLVPCCHVKDGARFGLGRVGDAPQEVLARRGALAAQLAAGRVPAGCSGCDLAHRVAAASAAARHPGRPGGA